MAKVFLADKETQDKIYNIVRDDQVYGFVEHMRESNPAKKIEYIGANKDFTPITQDLGQSKVNYGSWEKFPVIAGNKPWMVLETGIGDYRLNEDDYTKRLDGTASDVSNARYPGGAYSWLPRVYTRQEVYGDDRYVWFSFEKRNGFEAIGFREWNGRKFEEVEGVWLPMFYGSKLSDSVAGIFMSKTGMGDVNSVFLTSIAGAEVFAGNKTQMQHLFGAVSLWKGDELLRGYRLLQGAILNVITDLLILFAKTTDLKSVFGKGRQNIGVGSEQLKNDIVSGGQFMGTSDGNSLNKIFHSIVLGSYQLAQVDATMHINNTNDKSFLCVQKEETINTSNFSDSANYVQVAYYKSNLLDGTWRSVDTSRVKADYGAVPATLYSDAGIGDVKLRARSSHTCVRLSPGENASLRTYDFASVQIGSTDIGNGVGASTMLMPPIGLTP